MPLLRVPWVQAAQHDAAVDAVLAGGRRRLSLVDCVSFGVMRAHDVTEAFCFDEHFVEQGFYAIA